MFSIANTIMRNNKYVYGNNNHECRRFEVSNWQYTITPFARIRGNYSKTMSLTETQKILQLYKSHSVIGAGGERSILIPIQQIYSGGGLCFLQPCYQDQFSEPSSSPRRRACIFPCSRTKVRVARALRCFQNLSPRPDGEQYLDILVRNDKDFFKKQYSIK